MKCIHANPFENNEKITTLMKWPRLQKVIKSSQENPYENECWAICYKNFSARNFQMYMIR